MKKLTLALLAVGSFVTTSYSHADKTPSGKYTVDNCIVSDYTTAEPEDTLSYDMCSKQAESFYNKQKNQKPNFNHRYVLSFINADLGPKKDEYRRFYYMLDNKTNIIHTFPFVVVFSDKSKPYVKHEFRLNSPVACFTPNDTQSFIANSQLYDGKVCFALDRTYNQVYKVDTE